MCRISLSAVPSAMLMPSKLWSHELSRASTRKSEIELASYLHLQIWSPTDVTRPVDATLKGC